MFIGKALVQDEVVVALEGMAIDTGITVTMIGNHLLKFDGSLRQRLDGEGHILDETRGAHRTRTTHTGEDARTDGPVLAVDLRILCELRRDIQTELSQTRLDLLDLLKELLVGDALGLCEYRRQVVIVARLHTFYLACIHIFLILQEHGIVDTVKRHVVEHLSRLHHQVLGTHLQILVASLQLLHGHHSLTTLFHREEVDHRRSLELVVVERLHRHLREEGQRTLAAHHRMGYDIKGIIVGNERTEVKTRHILDAVFPGDAIGQFLVGSYLIAQVLNLLEELRMTLAESLTTLFVACIQDCSIRQDNSGRNHHTVAIGMDTTVHA